MKRIFFVYTIIIHGITVWGQKEAEVSDLVTDRPDRTESSVVVPLKSLQLETGFFYSASASASVEEREIGYGDLLVRFGLLERLELRIGIAASKIETQDVGAGNGIESAAGIVPLKTGLKIYISEQRGWIPELALLSHIYIPFRNSEITQTNVSPDIILSASHELSGKVSLGYNVGVIWFGDELLPNGTYSVAAGFGLTEKMGAFLETFGRYNKTEFVNSLDGGFTFLLMPNLQLDISGAVGLTRDAPDYVLGAGISWRIPQ